MKKKILNLALAGSVVGTGVAGIGDSVYAAVNTKASKATEVKDQKKQEQDITIIDETWKNGSSNTGWKDFTGVESQIIKDAENAFVGNHFLKVGAFGAIYNQVQLKPNTKYKMTVMIKSKEANLENHIFKMSLKTDPTGPNGRDIFNDRLNTTKEVEKGYREVSSEFTTNGDETNPLLVLQTFSDAYIGSIKLVKIADVAPSKPISMSSATDTDDEIDIFNAELGATVTAKVDGKVIATATAKEQYGNPSLAILKFPLQKAGTHIIVTISNSSGVITVLENTVAKGNNTPKAPEVFTVTDSDKTVKGFAEKFSKIEIKAGDKVIGSGTVDKDGRFNIAIPQQKAGMKLSVTVSNAYKLSATTDEEVQKAAAL